MHLSMCLLRLFNSYRRLGSMICPFDSILDVRLRELKHLIDNDLAAYDDFVAGELPLSDAEGLYQHLLADAEESKLPFRDPEELYQHLIATKFSEHKVFSHGDMSDGNISIDAQGTIGFIDWGKRRLCGYLV